MDKLYTTQEINALTNFNDPTGRGSGASRLIPRCAKAGLIIEKVNSAGVGNKNLYRILENNINLPNEKWITCYCKPDWEVSNLGRVRKINGKIPLGTEDSAGYVNICTVLPNGKTTQLRVHRLIYFSFFPNENEKNMIIDHIDGRRNNNALNNLRCLTNVENLQERTNNQTIIKTLTTELVLKYGYQETINLLQKLLKE